MDEAIHKLTAARNYQDAIAGLELGQNLIIQPDPERAGAMLAFTEAGECVGGLTARNAVSQAIISGKRLLHATVNSISAPGSKSPYFSPNVRIVVGDEGETFSMPPRRNQDFKLGLVGESHYQSAIERCCVGDVIALLEEPDNPYDSRAIFALSSGRGIIGYVPRDSWLTRAIIDERKIAIGIVASIEGPPGRRGVVLDVTLDPYGTPEVPDETPPTPAPFSPAHLEPLKDNNNPAIVIGLIAIAFLLFSLFLAAASG
jgi:hypothetical protein